MNRLSACLIALCVSLAAGPAAAQDGLFSPHVLVNGRAVSEYEFQQRELMLALFRTQGDIAAEALNGLIDDRLRMQEAKALGIKLAPDAVLAGMTEFAGRANLSAEEFVAALGQAGVAAETFRDFVEAGMAWREVIRARFFGRVFVSEKEIDRAIAAIDESSSVRLLLSEIVIAKVPGDESAAMAVARRLQSQVRGEEAFVKAVREFSDAPTAASGGQLGWQSLADMPTEMAMAMAGLQVGQVSPPVEVPEGVAVFLLREVDQGPASPVTTTEVEYALVNLSYARDPVAEAERLRTEADTCNDLNGLVPEDVPESGLKRETLPSPQLPGDLSLELARLDPGEGAPLARSGVPMYLMLCSRNPALQSPISREAVRNALLNQRLAALAEVYLEELRTQAIIVLPDAAAPPDHATD